MVKIAGDPENLKLFARALVAFRVLMANTVVWRWDGR